MSKSPLGQFSISFGSYVDTFIGVVDNDIIIMAR
jgi:hypothetical protein